MKKIIYLAAVVIALAPGGLRFSVAIDNKGEIANAWRGIELTPTTSIVNQQGDIVKRYVGEPDFVELHGLLETLLTEV